MQTIWRGPQLPVIEVEVTRRGLRDVQFLPFQSDEMFPRSLCAASIGVVSLDERVSRSGVPSKTYNLMSFGIPALYIAAPDSELARYVELYGHGGCFLPGEVDAMADFVTGLADDPDRYAELSNNARRAAQDSRHGDTERFVASYLAPSTSPT